MVRRTKIAHGLRWTTGGGIGLKLVVVSQRIDAWSDRCETRDALDQKLVEFLLEIDCLAVPISNRYGKVNEGGSGDRRAFLEWIHLIKPEAVLLSGGNDVGQYESRDTVEIWLTEYAQQQKLPLLGICRGMQLMAYLAGSTLEEVSDHVATKHMVSGEINSKVNSYHNLGLKRAPDGYEVLATSEDGVIEAIRHLQLPWEGWMWHPERESPFVKVDIDRARNLFGS